MGVISAGATIPGMIKKPRSAIGTVMIPSTIKSPIKGKVITWGPATIQLTLPPRETVNAVEAVVRTLSEDPHQCGSL